MKQSLAVHFALTLQTRHRRRCLASGCKDAIINLRRWEASTVALIGVSLSCTLLVKVKVKVTLEQATKYQRGSRGTVLLFLDYSTRRVWVVSFIPRPLLPTWKTRYPFYRRFGGPQGWSGQVQKFSPPTEFVHGTVGIKTKSQQNKPPLQAARSSIYPPYAVSAL